MEYECRIVADVVPTRDVDVVISSSIERVTHSERVTPGQHHLKVRVRVKVKVTVKVRATRNSDGKFGTLS